MKVGEFKGEFNICFTYFIFHLKYRVYTTIYTIKRSFNFILGLLELLLPNFVLNNLVSQNINTENFLVSPSNILFLCELYEYG